MKILILTQKVDINDDILGFFHRWIEEFAKNCELVTVVCLKKGEYRLPDNVRVLSLGKESGKSHLKYLFNFYNHILRERNNYDGIFVHMNHEYVILGAPLWKVLGKKIGLWYAHGESSLSLKISEKLTDVIFTSTESGFRIRSDKVKIAGQGIDTEKFNLKDKYVQNDGIFKIVTAGRISPIKDYETLIESADIMHKRRISFNIEIIGKPALPDQESYLLQLKEAVKTKGLDNVVKFIGSIPYNEIGDYFHRASVFVSTSKTGSLDKAMLEAMSCGLPVISCNEALLSVFGNYGELLMFEKNNYKELTEKIGYIMGLGNFKREEISQNMREIVKKNHNIKGLIEKILLNYK